MIIDKKIQRRIVVLDNNGQTFDRYTIIDRKTSDVYGASNNPFAPNGIGTYSHNIAYASGVTRNDERLNRICTKLYLKDSKSIGIRVKDLNSLPDKVKEYILQIAE